MFNLKITVSDVIKGFSEIQSHYFIWQI